MCFIRVSVEAYSGYKGLERPLRFEIDDRWIEVESVLDRWYEGGRTAAEPTLDYFKVSAKDGREYILRYNALFDGWAAAAIDHRPEPGID